MQVEIETEQIKLWGKFFGKKYGNKYRNDLLQRSDQPP